MRKLTWIAFGLAWTAAAAGADPVGFSVNQDSHDVSVVDLTTRTTRGTVPTLIPGLPNDPGSNPSDAVADPQSGRVYVATNFRLLSFDGRLSVGTSPPAVFQVNTRDKGSGLALDPTNRRLFMSHNDLPGFGSGIVEEFGLANPAQPVLKTEHLVSVAAGASTNLRFIAWDNRYLRLYVVASDGIVYRTGQGNLVFAPIATGAINPGGILADPSGGVWISSRNPGNLVRITEAGAKTSFAVGSATPRGLAWDASGSGSVLVAVDSATAVRRFRPNLGAFDAGNAMATAENPQDVGLTAAGAIVSLNRRTNIGTGNVTVAGVNQPVDTTGQTSIALAVMEVAKLTAVPASQTFCWNTAGDIKTKVFTVQNTRLDRASIDLTTVSIAATNANAYAVLGDHCSAARLKWGGSCQFTLQFTADGACTQPPPPFGGPQICYWPSAVTVSTTNAAVSAVIPISGRVAALPCPP